MAYKITVTLKDKSKVEYVCERYRHDNGDLHLYFRDEPETVIERAVIQSLSIGPATSPPSTQQINS